VHGLHPGSIGTTLVNITVPGWIQPGDQPLVVTVGGRRQPGGHDNQPAVMSYGADMLPRQVRDPKRC
jgi:hypothetical protein